MIVVYIKGLFDFSTLLSAIEFSMEVPLQKPTVVPLNHMISTLAGTSKFKSRHLRRV